MPATGSRRTPDELARLGAEVYESQVRPILRPADDNQFVAIDVVSGDFEINKDDYAAVTRLRIRRPESEVWVGRVGQPVTYRLGQVDGPTFRHGRC